MSSSINLDNSSPLDKSNTVSLDAENGLGANNSLVSPQNDMNVASKSKNEQVPVPTVEVSPSKEPAQISFSGPTLVQLSTNAEGKQNGARKFI